MRIEDIDFSLILPQPGMSNSSNDEEEEEKGFFAQLFKKKETPDKPFYEARIEELGYDEIYSELSDDPVIYQVRNTACDKAVILTKNYLVLPGQDIISLERITKYAICNMGTVPWEQYAEDRGLDTPYDPTYVSEYEGEEGFELERFKIRLAFIDVYGMHFRYDFYMEAADRRGFHEQLTSRCEGVDFTRDTVLDGKFDEEYDYAESDVFGVQQ